MTETREEYPAMEYVTIQEAIELTGRTERTIRRWIRDKKLPVQKLKNGKIMIARSDLEVFQAQSQPGTAIARIEALEQEVTALNARLELWERQGTRYTPGIAKTMPLSEKTPVLAMAAPGETIQLYDFAELHQVPSRTAKDHVNKYGMACTVLPKPNRPKEHRYLLTEEQQKEAIAFWRGNGTAFQRCTTPTCPCQA
jgi:excisionase family DNA binding protein